jgi:type I restriction enzyme S subunit
MSLSRHPRVGGDPVSSDSESIITEHIDLWTSSIKARNTQGRGSSKKRELYGIKKLRELILELAVRGKLVPQDSNEEPASELLKRITAEKEELIKDQKIRKQKPLLAVTDEEKTFELPDGWKWSRLGDLFNSILSGGTPSKRESTYWGGNIPWASVKDLGKERYIKKTQDYITQEGLDAGSKLADIDDVLICTRMGLGKIAIAATPIAINQDLKAVKLTTCVNVDFFLNTYSTIKIVGTGTTVAGIKQEELLSYVIALPPIEEQHRIVAKVDELMALCDQLEQQTETSLDAHKLLVDTLLASLLKPVEGSLTDARDANELSDNWARLSDHFDTLITTDYAVEQLKQTILQLAVMGKLVPQDRNDEPASELLKRIAVEKEQLIKDKKIKKQKPLPEISQEEKPFELPAGWEWVKVGNASLVTEYGISAKTFESEEGIPVLKMGDIQGGKVILGMHKKAAIDYDGISELMVKNGDVLYNRTNSAELVGKTGLYKGPDDIYSFASYLIRIQCGDNNVLPSFLNLNMNTPLFRKFQIEPYLKQQCGQANVNGTIMKNMAIAIAPLKEQIRIVIKVDELMTLCDQLKTRLNTAQANQLQLADTIVDEALN